MCVRSRAPRLYAYFAFSFLFCYPPFQALIFKLLTKWNSKIHLLSFIPSAICFAYGFTHRLDFYIVYAYIFVYILYVVHTYRSSYGATHIHYLFPDFLHFYFVHTHTRKKTYTHTPNSDCQIHKHIVWMNVYYENNLCLILRYTVFICFEWWKWTFIGWIEWVGIFIFDSTPFTNIECAVCLHVSIVRNLLILMMPFMYVYCYFQFLMG